MSANADEKQKFISEYCGEYAVALHDCLGLPIYVLKGYYSSGDCSIGYAFVSTDGGRTGLGACGVVPVDELQATCLFARRPRRVTVSRMSRENLAWELGIVEKSFG